MQKVLIFISTVFLFSCQERPKENIYIPPLEEDKIENQFYINTSLDNLWIKILQIDSLDFEIESKNSTTGQLKKKLYPKNISDYINCGMMNDEIYVHYIDRIFESSLEIETSLDIKKEKEELTSIQLISTYIFRSKETGTTWVFETNEPKLILVGNPAFGAEPYRKCASKHFLESSIIKEITKLE